MTRALRWGVPVLVALLAIVYFGVSCAIASQVATSEHNEQEEVPEEYGLQYEDVEFTSRTDGLTLRGWYIESEGQRADAGVRPRDRQRAQRAQRGPAGLHDDGAGVSTC